MNKATLNLSTAPHFELTPIERAVGRVMRAPDHDAGTAGDPPPAGGDAAAAAAAAEAAGDKGEPDWGAMKPDGDAKPDGDKPDADKGDADKGDADKGDDDTSLANRGDKPKDGEEGADKATVAPEKYELKVEGQEFDAEIFGKAEPVLRELNLSNDDAQKLVDVYAQEVLPTLVTRAQDAAKQQQAQDFATLKAEWESEVRADKDIGGANFERTIDRAAQVWDAAGIERGTGVRQMLDETGFGNHPDVLRLLNWVHEKIGEGGHITPNIPSDSRPIWDRVYSSEQKQ